MKHFWSILILFLILVVAVPLGIRYLYVRINETPDPTGPQREHEKQLKDNETAAELKRLQQNVDNMMKDVYVVRVKRGGGSGYICFFYRSNRTDSYGGSALTLTNFDCSGIPQNAIVVDTKIASLPE